MLPLQLLETAAGYQGNSGDLNAQFSAAAANNLTVVRMFGFGVASSFQLQYSPGSYNERAFQAFDKVPCHASMHASMERMWPWNTLCAASFCGRLGSHISTPSPALHTMHISGAMGRPQMPAEEQQLRARWQGMGS